MDVENVTAKKTSFSSEPNDFLRSWLKLTTMDEENINKIEISVIKCGQS